MSHGFSATVVSKKITRPLQPVNAKNSQSKYSDCANFSRKFSSSFIHRFLTASRSRSSVNGDRIPFEGSWSESLERSVVDSSQLTAEAPFCSSRYGIQANLPPPPLETPLFRGLPGSVIEPWLSRLPMGRKRSPAKHSAES